MTDKIKPKIIRFKDFPDFTPNLTPRQILLLGSFGGTYWRPITSGITKKKYSNHHKKYPTSWWKDIPLSYIISSNYDISINKYNVRVGTSLKLWEEKKWITKYHPYGWFHWYCDFYNGKRCHDDIRQIKRWSGVAGLQGRFRKWLVTLIKKKDGKYNELTVSPKIRQTLQHWGYQLTKKDFDTLNTLKKD